MNECELLFFVLPFHQICKYSCISIGWLYCLLWYWSVLTFFCRRFRYKVQNVLGFESLHITVVLQLNDTTLQEWTLPNLHFSVEGGRYWSPDLIFALFSVLREKNTILPYLMYTLPSVLITLL